MENFKTLKFLLETLPLKIPQMLISKEHMESLNLEDLKGYFIHSTNENSDILLNYIYIYQIEGSENSRRQDLVGIWDSQVG